MQQMAACSVDGAVHYHFMDWRHLGELLAAGKAVYGELLNMCVWAKTNAGMGSFYRSQHELVFVFKVGDRAPTSTMSGWASHGRHRSNVWSYPGVNSFGAERQEALAWHPTVKPVRLVADAILDASKRGGLVLDPFGGSGTSLIAAERTGRRARLIELEPKYVDVTIRRWQQLTGAAAVHAESGMRFDAVAGGSRAGGAIDRRARRCCRERAHRATIRRTRRRRSRPTRSATVDRRCTRASNRASRAIGAAGPRARAISRPSSRRCSPRRWSCARASAAARCPSCGR